MFTHLDEGMLAKTHITSRTDLQYIAPQGTSWNVQVQVPRPDDRRENPTSRCAARLTATCTGAFVVAVPLMTC
jgi:hypothetical protein